MLENILDTSDDGGTSDFQKNVKGMTGGSPLTEELIQSITAYPLQLDCLKANLRRYQVFGTQYILHQEKALLGDEMGLGKTVQAIAVMVSLKNTGATHFIVVCPASVLANWCREITKHFF